MTGKLQGPKIVGAHHMRRSIVTTAFLWMLNLGCAPTSVPASGEPSERNQQVPAKPTSNGASARPPSADMNPTTANPTTANPTARAPTTTSPAKPATAAVSKATFDSEQLGALLPASLGGWTLKTMVRPMPSPERPLVPVLQAEYVNGAQTVAVALLTYMPVPAGATARSIHYGRREDRQENTASLALLNGLTIVASSHDADAPTLAKVLGSIDLAKAEQLVRSQK